MTLESIVFVGLTGIAIPLWMLAFSFTNFVSMITFGGGDDE